MSESSFDDSSDGEDDSDDPSLVLEDVEGEDSDFENVPDEAGDAKKHCYYKDTTKTKDLELVVGMKFASGKIFREVLRDWEMLDDIGGLGTNRWSFISDRQKGLIEALRELVPDAEHRYCLRHMYANFKIKFKSAQLKEFFWKAASTANKQEFHIYMKRIAEIDPKIASDVETANDG
ncbi:hypothetical protein Sango_0109700 [Sesamum angolense]|uniref:MULE transposase domain-containing protein n=1 Tax=Sesamum angolense TaxID=2727404 RepID=A0AAE1XFA1_9LAMI|nr:hypothetical protein Sango_0109700 [Sesamum angolense]